MEFLERNVSKCRCIKSGSEAPAFLLYLQNMNFLGFLSLIITLAVFAWWFGFLNQEPPAENTTENVFENTLDAARGAADQLGN